MRVTNRTELLTKLRNDPAPYQQMRAALKIIGDRWSGLILLCLFEKPCRFTEIQILLPDLNPRTLSQRLNSLEAFGLIKKTEYKEFPPRTEYRLTEKAHELRSAMLELKKWAKKYC